MHLIQNQPPIQSLGRFNFVPSGISSSDEIKSLKISLLLSYRDFQLLVSFFYFFVIEIIFSPLFAIYVFSKKSLVFECLDGLGKSINIGV